MAEPLTILWTTAPEAEQAVLQKSAAAHGAKLLAVSIDCLAATVAGVLAEGPVVVVTAGGADATFALRLGVDAVIYAGDVTEGALEKTIQRARARARMRTAYRSSTSPLDGDISVGLTLVACALEHELCDPLLHASTKCKELSKQVRSLYEATDQLEHWAELVAGDQEPDRLEALRNRVPADTVQRALHEISTVVHRADALISLLSELSGGVRPDLTVRVPETLGNLRSLIAGYVSPWASIRLTTEGECTVRMPRPSFICMIGALILRAVEAVRATGRQGTVELRAIDHADQEGTVLIEIQDDGVPTSSDFGPEVLHPHFRIAPGSPALISIRERAREYGGDLLLQSIPSGTIVRLCLPSADSATAPKDVAPPDAVDGEDQAPISS